MVETQQSNGVYATVGIIKSKFYGYAFATDDGQIDKQTDLTECNGEKNDESDVPSTLPTLAAGTGSGNMFLWWAN